MLIGGTVFGATATHAQDANTAQQNLIQKIATRFNLNQADVQAVFDQDRTERQAAMKAEAQQRLNQLVTDGKITEAQKQLIITKQQELETKRESNKTTMQNLTPEQRKTAMDTQRQELQTWASQNGIDLQYLMFGHGGPGRGHGMMGNPNSSPSPAQ